MDINDLDKLVSLLEGSAVSEFEYEKDGTTIRISRMLATSGVAQSIAPMQMVSSAVQSGGDQGQSPKAALDESFVRVESPIVGTFYRKPNPDSDNFVEPGKRVARGDTLCIVEAMKLMNEIESPIAGTIEKILLEDSSVVEYGEVLFLIRPD